MNQSFGITQIQINNENKAICASKKILTNENVDHKFPLGQFKFDEKRKFGRDLKNVVNENNLNPMKYFRIDKNYENKENIVPNKNSFLETVFFSIY